MSGQATPRETDRGQLVLVAAVFIAVAFVPITVAYLQLGYSGDIEASGDTTEESLESTTRLLQRAVHTETNNTTWSHSNDTVTTIHSRLEPHVSAIETEHRTTVQRVRYNGSTAIEWADMNCPNGSARRFGPCTADRGVVVQERVGEVHLLAIAFDVTLTTEHQRIKATVIVRPIERLATTGTVTATQRETPQTRGDRRRTERTETTPVWKRDRTNTASVRTGETDEHRNW